MLYEHELLRERMAVEETAVRKRLEDSLESSLRPLRRSCKSPNHNCSYIRCLMT